MISRDNKQIKNALKLKQKKYRESQGQFLIEGIRFVESAIEKNAAEYIIYSERIFKTSGFDRVLKDNVKSYEVDDDILREICDTENPQGVVAVAKKTSYSLNDIKGNMVVVIDSVQDPGNLGTIIRTCDAAGVDAIIVLKGTVDVYNQKTLRSTMGSIFHIPIIFEDDFNEASSFLKENGFNILATSLEGSSSLYNYDFNKKTAVIMGNEANGVKMENMNQATNLILIPMEGSAESLNVGVATSVIVYEALRQRKAHN